MSGTLYVCATPIGNLKDITLRCLETLEKVDLIAAEDTRNTLKILNHYNIKNHLESYHEHNKHSKGIKLISFLKDGKDIALVSDAGMPGISDPGEDLIKLCYENNVNVTVLPGATASITALILSGMEARSYCFEGFLPSSKKFRKEVIERIKNDTRTYILYEAPHKLLDTLKELFKNLGNRNLAIIKELTKKYESNLKLNLEEAISYFLENTPKGEYVIILQGINKDLIKSEFEDLSIEEHVNIYTSKGLDLKTSMKEVAKARKISKSEVYKLIKVKEYK